MGVHNIQTMEEFRSTIKEHNLVVLDAFAVWCGPCKAIAPEIVKWSEQDEFKDKVYFAKFDVDDLPALAQELGVRAMPTFVVFKNGEKADEFVGANPPALLKVVEKHVAP
ncbi:hypothetical protein P8C59_000984 [Phyllachora maydis]|uniref:Thioredoxin n=1 Tax=Phyllachora maydis TaxID=1825666 RepID=A0AAD9HXH9_9PEZI|nr:hypothetical protein P8C59_000984 [Phyllachora maydis]